MVGNRQEKRWYYGQPSVGIVLLILDFLVGMISLYLLYSCATICLVMVRSIKSVLPRTVVNYSTNAILLSARDTAICLKCIFPLFIAPSGLD